MDSFFFIFSNKKPSPQHTYKNLRTKQAQRVNSFTLYLAREKKTKLNPLALLHLVNGQADYRSIMQLSLLKIKFRRLEQEYDHNTRTRSTSYRGEYQPDAVVGYG